MSREPVRVIDVGEVDPVRSQTVFHAVGYAMDESTPDTILLVSTNRPYVCIGYHQELEKEVDVEFCREAGLVVQRREVGGGAVYLDRGQVFCQWIFHPERLPATLEEQFALYIRPLVETYQALGINAYHRPVNDVHVDGKKIGGTGAAQIGAAEVLVGSLMFDFNTELMARVLRVPSEKFRDKVYQSLREYMTTMKLQLGEEPDRARVKALYLDRCAAALGRELVPGALTAAELEAAAELDERFQSDEWLYLKGGLRRSGVKIHEDVRIVEANTKAPGGLIRATARLHGDRIDDLSLSGDFTFLPAALVPALEHQLRGVRIEAGALRRRIAAFYETFGVESPGLTADDWVRAILALLEQEAPVAT